MSPHFHSVQLSALPAITSEIAPLGKLRVAMNAGNPVLIKRAPDGKIIGGVALEVGKFIAEKLGVSFELVPYNNATHFAELRQGRVGHWHNHVYIAAPGQESAQDTFLSRTLESAELVRMPGGRTDAIETLRSGKANLWVANATQAQAIVDGLPGAKIVPGSFNRERSSVALPKGRSSAAQGKIAEIVNEAKRTGIDLGSYAIQCPPAKSFSRTCRRRIGCSRELRLQRCRGRRLDSWYASETANWQL